MIKAFFVLIIFLLVPLAYALNDIQDTDSPTNGTEAGRGDIPIGNNGCPEGYEEEDGVCTEQNKQNSIQLTCTDSDILEAEPKYVEGNVAGFNESGYYILYDYCITDQEVLKTADLVEYICLNDKSEPVLLKCGNNCSGGKCLMVTSIPSPTDTNILPTFPQSSLDINSKEPEIGVLEKIWEFFRRIFEFFLGISNPTLQAVFNYNQIENCKVPYENMASISFTFISKPNDDRKIITSGGLSILIVDPSNIVESLTDRKTCIFNDFSFTETIDEESLNEVYLADPKRKDLSESDHLDYYKQESTALISEMISSFFDVIGNESSIFQKTVINPKQTKFFLSKDDTSITINVVSNKIIDFEAKTHIREDIVRTKRVFIGREYNSKKLYSANTWVEGMLREDEIIEALNNKKTT